MGLSPEAVAALAGILLIAALIHGSIGFGFPMVATPLLALVTDMQTAILLTLIPTILVNLVSIFSEGDMAAALRRHYLLALLAVFGSAIGTLILIFTQADIFKVVLAAAILIYLFADKIKLNLRWIRRYPLSAKCLFGISAGVLGGLTKVMAPPLHWGWASVFLSSGRSN